jgi:hypothetical protein
VDDPTAERHLSAEVVTEGVVQALLAAQPARERRKERIRAFMALDQRGERMSVSMSSVDCPAINLVQTSTL